MRRTHDLDAKDREILALLEEDAQAIQLGDRAADRRCRRRPSPSASPVCATSASSTASRHASIRRGSACRSARSSSSGPTPCRTMTRRCSSRRFPQIRDCYRVTGSALLMLIARVPTTRVFDALLAELYKHGETSTSVILNTEFEQRPIFTERGLTFDSGSNRTPALKSVRDIRRIRRGNRHGDARRAEALFGRTAGACCGWDAGFSISITCVRQTSGSLIVHDPAQEHPAR